MFAPINNLAELISLGYVFVNTFYIKHIKIILLTKNNLLLPGEYLVFQ